jgi:hypothetical protein
MAFVIADRVQETTTTTGTGTVLLTGAVQGYQSFATIGNANTTYYTIADQAGTDWEVGIGTYFAGNVSLGRTTVLSSSSGNTAVNFGSGVKAVFVTYPAERAIFADSSNITTITNLVSGNVAITGGNLTSVNVTTTAFSANSVTITGGTINNVSLSNITYGGLGTMSTQNANAVAITGGTINNVSLSNVTYGGLGTMSTQNANSVTITGGTLNNTIIGGTTATNASFTNLTLTNQLIANASAGVSGQMLTSAGANASPYWSSSTAALSTANNSVVLNSTFATSNGTVGAGYNGFSVGPVTVANNVTISVASGQRWIII